MKSLEIYLKLVTEKDHHKVIGILAHLPCFKYVRANLRRMVKRVLRHYGYPPDKEARAVELVIQQAELSAGECVEV